MIEREVFEWTDLHHLYISYMKEGKNPEGKIVEIEQKRVQKLPEIFKCKNGLFVIKVRQENLAIYQKIATKEGLIDYYYFEAIRIKKINNKKNLERFNKSYGTNYDLENAPDFKEVYPKDEDFGKIAWAYPTLEKANDCIKKIEDKYAEASPFYFMFYSKQ